MSLEEDDFSRAVATICGRAFTQPAVNLLRKIIEKGDAPRLVSAVVTAEQASGKTAEDAVSETMLKLESLGEISHLTACMLMVHLSLTASKLRLHDVWDAIDLWIYHCDSSELTNYLHESLHPRKIKGCDGIGRDWLSSGENREHE